MNIKEYLIKHGFDPDLIEIILNSKKYKRILPIKKRNSCNSLNLNTAYILYDKYNLPFYKIAMLYGVSDTYMKRLLNSKFKIISRGHCCGINSQNNYFENIDTADKAYFLGFIFADGSVTKNKSSYMLSLEIHQQDKYILERFLKYTNLSGTIKDVDNKSTCYLRIGSKKIFDDLSKYNVIPNKCHLDPQMPSNIPEHLINHFIRGFFDGDGIAFTKPHIGFCGSKSIITFIRNRFVDKYNLNSNCVTYNKFNHIYYVQWSQIRDIKVFYDIIYKDKSDLFLMRKFLKIQNNLAPIYGNI